MVLRGVEKATLDRNTIPSSSPKDPRLNITQLNNSNIIREAHDPKVAADNDFEISMAEHQREKARQAGFKK